MSHRYRPVTSINIVLCVISDTITHAGVVESIMLHSAGKGAVTRRDESVNHRV
jgi:hypothetical protein